GGGTEHAAGAGDVPAERVMLRVNCVAETAFGLYAKDERVQQIRPADWRIFGIGQNGRGDRARRGNDRLQMRVVEIENMRAYAVQEGRVHDGKALCSAKNACLVGASEGR